MWGRSSSRTNLTLGVLILSALLCLFGCQRGHPSEPLTVAAAVSLKQVMPALTGAFRTARGGPEITVTYGASGDLRRQVEGGAPIDAVVLANADTVDQLVKSGHADAATRRVVATNTLVLIGPKRGEPLTFATIDTLHDGELIAIGEPGAVPAGQYARQALQQLGKWDALQGRLVFGGDVGAVLNYARRGEVAAAVVYRTEIRGIDDVTVLDEAKGDWVPRVEVVAAAVTGAHAASGAVFVEFLTSAHAQPIFREYGFGAP